MTAPIASKNTVDYCRPEYAENLILWRYVADACAGEAAIKRERELYLPRPNPMDISVSATKRYEQYLHRAVYYNACGRTLTSLVGMAFSGSPDIQTPPETEYLADNADGAGHGVVQVAQETLGEVLRTTRAGLMVDFPPSAEGQQTSKLDVASGKMVATINLYPAHSIINWREERIGGAMKLTLVVLRESTADYADFSMTATVTYRVLRLIDGVYTQEVWTKPDDAKDYVSNGIRTMLDGTGQPWREIPFEFVGSEKNTPDIQSFCGIHKTAIAVSPLFDIAVLNIAHFRNSADYEESVFLVGQPQPWMTGLTEEWRDKLMKEGISLGSRVVLPLPIGGAFGIATAQPNSLASEAMRSKEEQMRALGAKLIQPNKSSKTATQSGHDESNDKSTLSLVCDNLSFAFTKALKWASIFMGGNPEDVNFSIDTEFVISPLNGPEILAVIQAYQSGLVPQSDAWSYLQRLNVINPEKTDDDIRQELESETATTSASMMQAVMAQPALQAVQPTPSNQQALVEQAAVA